MNKKQYQRRERLLRIRQALILLFLFAGGLSYAVSEQAQHRTEILYSRITGIPEEGGGVENAESIDAESIDAESVGSSGAESAGSTLKNTVGKPEKGLQAGEEGAELQIDLNTADKEALCGLPGIGPATADRILEYRERHGGFAATEELMNVKRIGEKTYERLKPFVRV